MAVKEGRSSTKPAKSPIEKVRDEMSAVVTDNRYGKGPASKADLIAKISDWRSQLADL
jgi:hypothetical protein